MAKCVNCNKEVSFWSSKIEGDYHYCDNCWNNTNEEEREKIVEQKERSKQIQIGKEIRKRDKKFLDMNFWSWCLNNNEFFLYLGLLVLIFWFLIGFNDIVYFITNNLP